MELSELAILSKLYLDLDRNTDNMRDVRTMARTLSPIGTVTKNYYHLQVIEPAGGVTVGGGGGSFTDHISHDLRGTLDNELALKVLEVIKDHYTMERLIIKNNLNEMGVKID